MLKAFKRLFQRRKSFLDLTFQEKSYYLCMTMKRPEVVLK